MGHFGLQALAVLLVRPQKILKGPEPREHWGRRSPEVGRIAIVEQQGEAVEQTAPPG